MKNLLFILIFFFTLSNFGQAELRPNPYIKGHIILKKGDTIKGYIKLNNSEWDVRFKDSIKQRKSQKIKYKNVEKMITNIESLNPREFYYMKTDKSKFLNFVEKVYSNNISIYINSSNELASFYADFDRRTTQEWMNDMNYRNPTNFLSNNEPSINIKSERTAISYGNNYNFFGSFNMNYYANIKIPSLDYYLLKKGEQKLIYVGTEGNIIRRGFKEFAIKYFKDCPNLIQMIENKELKLQNLTEIIMFYNNNCAIENEN